MILFWAESDVSDNLFVSILGIESNDKCDVLKFMWGFSDNF